MRRFGGTWTWIRKTEKGTQGHRDSDGPVVMRDVTTQRRQSHSGMQRHKERWTDIYVRWTECQ